MKLVSKSDIFFTLVICAVSLLIFFVFATREEGTSVIITLSWYNLRKCPKKQKNENSTAGRIENSTGGSLLLVCFLLFVGTFFRW